MDEKTIITSKLVNIKAIAIAFFAILAAIPNAMFFRSRYIFWSEMCSDWDWTWDWVIKEYGENANVLTVIFHQCAKIMGLITLVAAVIAILFYLCFSKTELIVTDKRVYGKTSFGKRVDLPFDSISAVGTAVLKSLAVTTASGAIKFSLLKNRDELHEAISKLLIARQGQNKPKEPATIHEIPQSNADELKKYKALLDSGVLTQEEFDAKKKQLLGL